MFIVQAKVEQVVENFRESFILAKHSDALLGIKPGALIL
jgi:hypothetical protein